MRRFALLLTLNTAAGCGAAAESPVFFLAEASNAGAQCIVSTDIRGRGSVADVVESGDSTIAVLYGQEREIVTYDAGFEAVEVIRFDRDGPRGIREPASVAVTSGGYIVADQGARLVKYFDSSGQDRGVVELDFVPYRVRAAGDNIVITPMVIAGNPANLAMTIRAHKAIPLPIPIARYEDGAVAAFANLASVATFPNGRAVVMHELVVPYGYSVELTLAQDSVKRFPVPLPVLVRDRVERLPDGPISDSNIGELLAVALTATPNVRTGGIFVLTRSGKRMADGGWEKMVVELDSTFAYRRSFSAPGRPLHMVHFAARSSILLVDDEDVWYECKLK